MIGSDNAASGVPAPRRQLCDGWDFERGVELVAATAYGYCIWARWAAHGTAAGSIQTSRGGHLAPGAVLGPDGTVRGTGATEQVVRGRALQRGGRLRASIGMKEATNLRWTLKCCRGTLKSFRARMLGPAPRSRNPPAQSARGSTPRQLCWRQMAVRRCRHEAVVWTGRRERALLWSGNGPPGDRTAGESPVALR